MATLDPERARPASPPRHDVTTDWDVRIPTRDGIELSASMMDAWRGIAASGTPGASWPPYTAETDPYAILDTPPRPAQVRPTA